MSRSAICIARVAACGLLAAVGRAQVRRDWTATYASPGFQTTVATAVTTDPAGNVFAAGTGSTFNGTSGHLFVASWSSSGQPAWNVSYDGPLGGSETAWAIAADGAGGLYVAGAARAPFYRTSRELLVKVSTSGALLWAREFGRAAGSSTATSLVIDAQGRILVAGNAASAAGDFTITAFDAAGTQLWETHFDGAVPGAEAPDALALAPNGDVIAGGAVADAVYGFHSALLRLDPNGRIVWSREYQPVASPFGYIQSLAVDASDRIFAGMTVGQFSMTEQMAAAAFDGAGNELWFRTVPGTYGHDHSGAAGIAIDPFGRAILAGTAWTTPSTYGDFAVAAFDPSGAIQWSRFVDNPGGSTSTHIWDVLRKLLIDPAGNIDLVGTSGVYINDSAYDVVAVGLDPFGEIRFTASYSTPPIGGVSWDAADSAALSGPDGLVVVGQGQLGASPYDVEALVVRWTRTAVTYCFGDGSGAACPCGNASAPIEHAGCASTTGSGGRLVDAGESSLAHDTFALLGSAMPASARAMFLQGTTTVAAGAGQVFGDGLRCVNGSIVRLATRTNSGGASRVPALGEGPISVRGGVVAPGTRAYQILYRDPSSACTGARFNLSNGLLVTWTP